MKRILALTLLLVAFCCVIQAKKTVKLPYFLARNNKYIEIEAVTLSKKSTVLDVKLYGRAGSKVSIEASTILRVDGKDYALRSVAGLAVGEFVPIPATGELSLVMQFDPLPESTESFDYIETPGKSDGWSVWGIRLDGKKPQVDLPESVKTHTPNFANPLPSAEFHAGKTVITGRLLGYKPEYDVKVSFRNSAWYFSYFLSPAVNVAADGTFRIDTEVMLPTKTTLSVAGKSITLFIIPNGTLDVTVSLPAVYWAESRLLSSLQNEDNTPLVWFNGDYDGLNTDIQTAEKLLKTEDTGDFFEAICGMTPLEYKKFVMERYDRQCKTLADATQLSEACRQYMRIGLDMGLNANITGYKSTLQLAPVLTMKKGVKRADMAVDSTSYFKEALALEVLRTPEARLSSDYLGFVRNAVESFHQYFKQDPEWPDLLFAKRASKNLAKNEPMTEAEKLALDSVKNSEIKRLFMLKDARIRVADAALIAAQAGKTGYTVLEVGKDVAVDSLLDVMTRPYRGRKVLVDMWNTWCRPCMNAMKLIASLKEQITDVVYIYVADETSPETKWRATIPDIKGVHYRITNKQSAAMCKKYQYSAIPTYFVISPEGKITYQTTGFPGIDVLRKELQR